MIGLFANALLQPPAQTGQLLTCSYSIFTRLRSGGELSDALTEPGSLFVSSGIESTVLLLPRRAASLTKALVALARTALELTLVSHQANLVLLPSGQSMPTLLVLAASLGPNGIDCTCSL